MSGWKEWQIGEVVEAADFQSFVQDQIVQVYADSAARGSALGTAVSEGMVSYLQDSNATQVYDGSDWIAIGAGDITDVVAGTALTGGGSSGSVTLNVDESALFTGGTLGFTALSNGTAGLSYQPVSHNYIINGAFDIWQRGDGPFTAEGVYTADRWRLSLSGGVASVTKEAFTTGDLEVPSFGNATNYLKLDVTTGDNNMQVQQRIEEVTELAGQEVTISFYAKGTNPGAGAIYLSVFQIFGSGGSANVTATDKPITYTGTWARYSHTFTMPSVSGKTIGTNGYLGITFRQGSGDTSTDAWELNLWGVQLEAGSIATPFKRHAPSLQGELAACARYYERIDLGRVNTATSGTSTVMSLPYMTRKRSTPSVSTNATNANYATVWQFSQSGVSLSSKSGTATINFDGSDGSLNHLQINIFGATYSPIPNTLESISGLYFEASAEL